MSEFVLNVQDIDEAGKHYDFPLRPEWLADALRGTDVRVHEAAPVGRFAVRIHKQGADLVLQGRLTAGLAVECARCLGDARIDVATDVASLLTARAADLRPQPDELELTPEDLEREFYSGDQVVLDAFVRENLLLEVPIKPLCTEECPGIPVPDAVSGPAELRTSEEGSVDPRLAPLMEMVGKLKSTEE